MSRIRKTKTRLELEMSSYLNTTRSFERAEMNEVEAKSRKRKRGETVMASACETRVFVSLTLILFPLMLRGLSL